MKTIEEKQTLTVAFALIQSGLAGENLIDKETGVQKKIKNPSLQIETTLWIYKWLIDKLRKLDDSEYFKYIEDYNKKIKKLNDEYIVDELVMGISLLERWVIQYGSEPDKILLNRKLTEIFKYCSEGIKKKYKENALSIIKDSIAAADNGFRIMTGKPELTKEVRRARLQKWRNMSNSKYKT